MAATSYLIERETIGTVKCHSVEAATWDNKPKMTPTGETLYDAVLSCELGRFSVRFPSRTLPYIPPRSEVEVVDLAIVGWGRTAPYFTAKAVVPLTPAEAPVAASGPSGEVGAAPAVQPRTARADSKEQS